MAESTTLKNKTAIITGSSRGIGKEIAKTLIQQGANVIISSRKESAVNSTGDELQTSDERVLGVSCDVTKWNDVNNLVEKTLEKFGQIDILINNAGIGGESPEDFWKVFEVNMKGPMQCALAIIPHMIKQKSGLMINMGSYVGIRPSPSNPPYAASKAALVRFSDSMAEMVKEHNINIFTVSPGLVYTDMTKDVPYFKNLPKDAWSPIEKIAELVVKLASKDVSTLSGKFIHVNDDLDRLLENAEKITKDGLYTLRLPTLDGLIE